jgi:hypothetical protein
MRPQDGLGICILLCAAALTGLPASAGNDDLASGIDLKLMVTDCTDDPLDNAFVEVVIYRPGTGIIASDDGSTDDGEISFRFNALQCDDEARVTLTLLTSDAPDAGHTYVYVGSCLDEPSLWVLTTPPRFCPDGWWDTTRIQSIYETSN